MYIHKKKKKKNYILSKVTSKACTISYNTSFVLQVVVDLNIEISFKLVETQLPIFINLS